MGRFDYVKYDDRALAAQNHFKDVVQDLEADIQAIGSVNPTSSVARAKSLALTKLEEVYMWIGKALRDDQIERNGTAELQEGRRNV